jgi:hypothetical protein
MFLHPWVTEIRHVRRDVAIDHYVGYGQIRVRAEDDTWVDSHRIVLPHFWRGNLVGWQTRRLTDDGTAKYLSSPDFPKDHTIYDHKPGRDVVVVESMLSVLTKAHLDQPIEATFGAKVTDRQIDILARHKSVTLFMDADEAGWKATHHLGVELAKYLPVWVAPCPYAADVGDLDDDTYLELLEQRIPYAVWREPTELIPWSTP